MKHRGPCGVGDVGGVGAAVPAHDAQQEIFGTANREGDKEMQDPRLAMQMRLS